MFSIVDHVREILDLLSLSGTLDTSGNDADQAQPSDTLAAEQEPPSDSLAPEHAQPSDTLAAEQEPPSDSLAPETAPPSESLIAEQAQPSDYFAAEQAQPSDTRIAEEKREEDDEDKNTDDITSNSTIKEFFAYLKTTDINIRKIIMDYGISLKNCQNEITIRWYLKRTFEMIDALEKFIEHEVYQDGLVELPINTVANLIWMMNTSPCILGIFFSSNYTSYIICGIVENALSDALKTISDQENAEAQNKSGSIAPANATASATASATATAPAPPS